MLNNSKLVFIIKTRIITVRDRITISTATDAVMNPNEPPANSEVGIFHRERGYSKIFMTTEITALFILNPFRDWNRKFTTGTDIIQYSFTPLEYAIFYIWNNRICIFFKELLQFNLTLKQRRQGKTNRPASYARHSLLS